MEWWYSSEGGSGRLRKKGGAGTGGKALRAPPSPSSPSPSADSAPSISKGLKPLPTKGKCVIHAGDIINCTALPTGWLGCYKCLFTWVEERGVCPVEGTKVGVGELRKIVG